MRIEKQHKIPRDRRNLRRIDLIRFGQIWLCVLALFTILFCWYFWSRAGEYQDRYAVLSAMLRLKIGDEKVVLVGGHSNVVLVETQHGYRKIFDRYMQSLGWQYVDQMGSAVYYRQGKRELTVNDFALSSYFRIQCLGCNPHKVLRR